MPSLPFVLFFMLTVIAWVIPPFSPTSNELAMWQAFAETPPAKAKRLSMTRPVTNTNRNRLSVGYIRFLPFQNTEAATCPIRDAPSSIEPTSLVNTHLAGHTRWGMTTHKLGLQICRRCGLVLQFSAGHGIWDLD